jgi:X-X-X-Leu-X-X-Gly heptad repeat protein
VALPKLEAAYASLQVLVRQMTAANGKIASGLSQMADALTKMSDGIDQLENTAKVVRIASEGQAVGVDLARNSLAQAALRSPCAGVVKKAVPGGQMVMVGAPVVVIRPKGPTLVDAYLAPDQIGRVKVGDPSDVTFDSVPKVLKGTVSTVWPTETFPPTNYPTRIVHLSGAVRVTVTVPDERLPLGIPADVVIHPSP